MRMNKITATNIFSGHRSKLKLISNFVLIVLYGLPATLARASELDSEENTDVRAGAAFDAGLNVDNLLQVLIALISVICIIFILSILVKKFNILPGASSGIIKIVAGISLSGKDRLLLIQVGDEQILVSASPGSISKIHELSTVVKPELISASQNPKSGNFSSLLNSVISRPRP